MQTITTRWPEVESGSESYPVRSCGVAERWPAEAADADGAGGADAPEVLVTGLIMAGTAARLHPVVWFM